MWEETLSKTRLNIKQTKLVSNFSIKERTDPFLIFLIAIISVSILTLFLKFRIVYLWSDFLQSTAFLRIATYPLVISAVIVIAGLIFRTFFWLRYNPLAIKCGEKVNWPFISVLMPALNEEELIQASIDSIFAIDYPPEKFEVICINDGSTDSTLSNMLKAKEKYGERLTVINFSKNLGKRKAIYASLKKSQGEIIVTVDTDSQVEKSSIKNLALPLINDKNVGAVAGRVEVLNEKQNFLTRMLSIRYSISFNFGRAFQSVYGAVFCCPGALSAYRKDVLNRFIREWVNQKFLNTPCTYGEDRALTTQILKLGYMTRFQSNAIVYTKVPSTFGQMSRMYLRWARSYVRESILFAEFMFSHYRSKHRFLPIYDFLFLNSLPLFHIFTFGLITYSFFVNPFFIIRHLAFLVTFSFILSLYYLRTNKSATFLYGIPYGIITAFCLWWIVPYAILTMKNRSWMTH